MKKILLLTIFIFITFYFFGNEKEIIIADDASFALNVQGLIQNDNDLSMYSIINGFIIQKTAAKKTTTGIPWKINLMIGIGFMVSGQVLFWVLGAPILAAGIVLMNYTEYHTYAERGWYTDAPYYNQGLALTIAGGISMVTGIAFIIVSGVNFGIAASKNKKTKKSSLENFALILDYNMKNEEFILGVDFKL